MTFPPKLYIFYTYKQEPFFSPQCETALISLKVIFRSSKVSQFYTQLCFPFEKTFPDTKKKHILLIKNHSLIITLKLFLEILQIPSLIVFFILNRYKNFSRMLMFCRTACQNYFFVIDLHDLCLR